MAQLFLCLCPLELQPSPSASGKLRSSHAGLPTVTASALQHSPEAVIAGPMRLFRSRLSGMQEQGIGKLRAPGALY